MHRDAGLDGLRAIAISAVLLVHDAPNRFTGGYLGVDLFFVLSGFLITSKLLEEERATGRINLVHFYQRRATRILPPLIVGIVLALAAGSAFPSAAIPALLFYSNLAPPETLGTLGVAWSLSVEEHFYLAWPLLLMIVPPRGRLPFLAAICVAALGLRLAWFDGAHDIYRWTITRMDGLAFGCIGAILGRQVGREVAIAAAIAMLVSIALAGAPLPRPPLAYTEFSVLCLLTLLGVRQLPLLAIPPMAYLGSRSYGIYLYHLPVFSVIDLHHGLATLIVRLVATLAVAELSYRTVERFALRWRPVSRPDEWARPAAVAERST